MVARKHYYYDHFSGYLPCFYRTLSSPWMVSNFPECSTSYDSNYPTAVGISGITMESAKAPNRHDFETEIWRLNNAISKLYKEIETYWTDEKRTEAAELKTEEINLKKSFNGLKEETKSMESNVKKAQLLFNNKQRELRELEDGDLVYKDPEQAKLILDRLQNSYNNQRFSNAREEQLIVKEIERAKRNVTKLSRYLPILNECKDLELKWKEERNKYQKQKRLLWETRDRWTKIRQNLKKIREPVLRYKYHLTELKAQKKVLIAKYNDERNNYQQWIKNHKSQGLSSFPQALLHDNSDELEPFLEKKRVCNRLTSYLNQLLSSIDNDLPKDLLAEVTEIAEKVCANNRKHRISMESEDSADDFPASFSNLHIKNVQINDNKFKKRANGKKSLKKSTMPITHDIDYYRLFNDINIQPPKTYGDVADTLNKVKNVLEFYEEQTRIALNDDDEDDRDLCLSPIPSMRSMNGSDYFESPLLSPHSTSSTSLFYGDNDDSSDCISRTSSYNKFTNVDTSRNSM